MTTPALSLDGITKVYGDVTALRDMSLEVAEGEVFGLLGHNGAGKTTTVSILTTLVEPTSGHAQVNGSDVANGDLEVRRSIGYLPEHVQFYDALSLRENLSFFARLSGLAKPDERIDEVLALIHFTGCEDRRLSGFSKGMRQRAGIAQAILHAPAVLFLDEPTSGLDPAGVRMLRETIIALNRELGMTIFMNTHLLAEVTKTCTSIGILRQGELIHHASLAETAAAFPTLGSLEDIYIHLESGTA